MSEQTKKPWGFGLMGNKKGTKSLLTFFVILVLSILVQIGGYAGNYLKEDRQRPALALKSFLRDLREFIQIEKRMPDNLRELEVKIWNKDKPAAPSRLQYGDWVMVAENYQYIYFSGKVEGVSVANVWAIPLGKFRDEFETVMLVISANGEDTWRGPALNAAQVNIVLNQKFNPTYPQMASLNMSKDSAKSAQPPQERKRFGLF